MNTFALELHEHRWPGNTPPEHERAKAAARDGALLPGPAEPRPPLGPRTLRRYCAGMVAVRGILVAWDFFMGRRRGGLGHRGTGSVCWPE